MTTPVIAEEEEMMNRRELTIILETIEQWTGPHLTHMPNGTAAVLVSELSDKLYGTTGDRVPKVQAEYRMFWEIQGAIRGKRKTT